MNATVAFSQSTSVDERQGLRALRGAIEHAAHLLPSQAPIQVFVHHNTLHAFEDQPFDEAVKLGAETFGCQAYLAEDRYQKSLARGRILPQDLSAVLIDDLGDDADQLISFLGTRYRLRLAMLQHPLRPGRDAELRWLIAEADALRRFCKETASSVREQMIDQTRRWVMRDLRNGGARPDGLIRNTAAELIDRFGRSKIEQWNEATWEAFTLHLLWQVCRDGMRRVPQPVQATKESLRHRDLLLAATGQDIDRPVNEVLIRFCAAFLDQGLAAWTLPGREEGFFQSWVALHRGAHPVDRWLRGLPKELKRLQSRSPLEIIAESLHLLGIDEPEEEFLAQTLLALPGWAGIIWQMETNAEWTVHPAPEGTLVEYVAVRLILERLALAYFAGDSAIGAADLSALRSRLRQKISHEQPQTADERAFVVFQLAQTMGWKPVDLHRLSTADWSNLVQEIEEFSSLERRRIYHLAFERRYRNQICDAIIAQARHANDTKGTPAFQVVCCLDEREESFRRHLEEIAPACETFGAAGFFGIAMYYRGIVDAHYVPLCPIIIKPRHYVREEVAYSFEQSHRRRTETRRALGKAWHALHTASRSVLGGALTAILGPLVSVPLVARVLFPRLTARIRRVFSILVQPPPVTRLLIERKEENPSPAKGHLGYNVEEMVDIAQRVLQDIGLSDRFARLVIVAGHGSSSLNNPHESAYNCGACGGGRGGPNARALAGVLNDPRVRQRLAARGLTIPEETTFVGAFHNTCDDSLTYYDLDRLPSSHRDDFEVAHESLDEARKRNAHERCRRFESAALTLSPESALRHVEGRSEDLSQARPECGHATNAICFVGRRWRTRGLFLDRRAFLTSYDPAQDDAQQTILTRILQAAIPVCAGINLEYYFSYIDPAGYGCSTKLPHNITALLGVMDGAASDLRPGLPWQMVEIHEPVRILFIIETDPAALLRILKRNPAMERLVRYEWVQLATLDPGSAAMQIFRHGQFEPYEPETTRLPVVRSSVDWYRGWRDHLGCASVLAAGEPENSTETGGETLA